MKCPTCTDSTLVMADRQGIEIDYCPACRGVWLDRGELDKLIERSASAAPAQAVAAPVQAAPQPVYRGQPDFVDSDHHHRGQPHNQGYGYTKRKKSWMSEIFD